MKLTLVRNDGVLLKPIAGARVVKLHWAKHFDYALTPDVLKWQDNDCNQKKFLWDRINGSSSFRITVSLNQKDSHESVYVQLSSHDKDRNILKQLWETFGEKVKISVWLEALAEPNDLENSRWIFEDDLKIEIDIKTGDGYCWGDHLYDIDTSFLRHTRFDITVMAVISDDHELIRQSEHVIPVSLRMNRKILNEGVASDAVIISKEGKEIKCHKSFLIAASPVLQGIFETRPDESQTGRIDMSNLSEEAVIAFLRYIYCGDTITIEPRSELDLSFELLYASHKYKVRKLEKFMIAHWMDVKENYIGIILALRLYMFVKNIEAAFKLKARLVQILHRKYAVIEGLPGYDDLEFCKALMESKGKLPKYDDLFKTAKDAKGPPTYDEIYKTPNNTKELCEDLKKVFEAEKQ